MMRVAQPCVACGGALTPFGYRLNYLYASCSACGTIQLAPLPTKHDLIRAYAEEYAKAGHYEQDADVCKRSARTYYRAIERVLKDYGVAGLVLDYGAGWGGMTEELLSGGFAVKGIELSREMVDYCRHRGLPVQQGDIGTIQGHVFSAIALCTVFEHLVEHEDWMTRVNRLLEHGGLLVTLQPTAPFADLMGRLARLGNPSAPLPMLHQTFCPPWHTVLFSLNGMVALSSRCGFEVMETRPAPQGRVAGLRGMAQIALEMLNRLGWRLTERRWPLLTAHIFVLRKVAEC